MDIYQLKTFVTVAAEGSVTKALSRVSEEFKLGLLAETFDVGFSNEL